MCSCGLRNAGRWCSVARPASANATNRPISKASRSASSIPSHAAFSSRSIATRTMSRIAARKSPARRSPVSWEFTTRRTSRNFSTGWRNKPSCRLPKESSGRRAWFDKFRSPPPPNITDFLPHSAEELAQVLLLPLDRVFVLHKLLFVGAEFLRVDDPPSVSFPLLATRGVEHLVVDDELHEEPGNVGRIEPGMNAHDVLGV